MFNICRCCFIRVAQVVATTFKLVLNWFKTEKTYNILRIKELN